MYKYLLLGVIALIFIGCGSSGSIINSGDGTDSENNSSFSVDITSQRINYKKDENVTLELNITGDAGENPIFTWSEKNITIGSDRVLIKDDFNVSSHHVSVIVEGDVETKRASFDFDVSYFKTEILTDRKDEVLVDTNKSLMWVSDMNTSKHACLAVHHDNDAEKAQRATFCEDLTFAGLMDWRKPTVDEISNFIKETVNADILPAYYAPCKILIGTDNGGNKAVITRYGDKKLGTLGEVLSTVDDALNSSKNIGLRCVRTIN